MRVRMCRANLDVLSVITDANSI